MCGRFTLTFTLQEAKEEFKVDEILNEFNPSFNVAPSQEVPVVVAGSRILDAYKWGLIPHWAKDMKIGYKMINARAETVAEKPSYKHAFLNNRCLMLASGFFEWKKAKEGKVPHYITLIKRKMFAFAGISSEWKSPEGNIVKSCSIITTAPNPFMEKIHDRMPVILKKENENEWLESKNDNIEKLKKLLVAYPEDEMQEVEVSKIVNSPKNNSKECIEAV